MLPRYNKWCLIFCSNFSLVTLSLAPFMTSACVLTVSGSPSKPALSCPSWAARPFPEPWIAAGDRAWEECPQPQPWYPSPTQPLYLRFMYWGSRLDLTSLLKSWVLFYSKILSNLMWFPGSWGPRVYKRWWSVWQERICAIWATPVWKLLVHSKKVSVTFNPAANK